MSDQPQSHKIDTPAPAEACEGALGAGIWASKQASALGSVGADTYADRTCQPPKTFASVQAVLAEQDALTAANKPPIKAFALPNEDGALMQERQVKVAIEGLENQLGHKLDYVWFDDDKGKAQVFLLGASEKQAEAAPPKPTDVAATNSEGCVPPGSLVDNSQNLRHNIAPGTTFDQAAAIMNERDRQANLARQGIALDLSDDAVKTILLDRDAKFQAQWALLPDPQDRSDAEQSTLDQNQKAIELGLPVGTPADEVSKVSAEYDLQSRALKFGMNQYASESDLSNLQKTIAATPDQDLNLRMGLPLETTSAQADLKGLIWSSAGTVAELGFDPAMDRLEVKKIAQQRLDKALPYDTELNARAHSPEELQALKLASDAIHLGLPEDSTAQTVEQTRAEYDHQATAVRLGLDRMASDQDIAFAQARLHAISQGSVCRGQ